MKIYTDSSFDESNKVAGIGIYIDKGGSSETISNFIKADDNNYAEMYAIFIAALIAHGKDCTIYTDSQISVAYIKDTVKEKGRTFEEYKKHQRMKLLAYKIRKLKPKVEWIKGHQRVYELDPIGNQIADILSHQGRAKCYNKGR